MEEDSNEIKNPEEVEPEVQKREIEEEIPEEQNTSKSKNLMIEAKNFFNYYKKKRWFCP